MPQKFSEVKIKVFATVQGLGSVLLVLIALVQNYYGRDWRFAATMAIVSTLWEINSTLQPKPIEPLVFPQRANSGLAGGLTDPAQLKFAQEQLLEKADRYDQIVSVFFGWKRFS